MPFSFRECGLKKKRGKREKTFTFHWYLIQEQLMAFAQAGQVNCYSMYVSSQTGKGLMVRSKVKPGSISEINLKQDQRARQERDLPGDRCRT